MKASMVVEWLGRIGFGAARELQEEYASRVGPGRGFLLLLEHDPVITLGKNAKATNVLADEATLAARGTALVRTDRGGDVTYHGPGQLVAYPIMRLRDAATGAGAYAHALERAMIETARRAGVEARAGERAIGVWSAAGKIGSVGVRIKEGVTRHGIALNVDMDLTPFTWIHPCGQCGGRVSDLRLSGGRVTSVEEAGRWFAEAWGGRLK